MFRTLLCLFVLCPLLCLCSEQAIYLDPSDCLFVQCQVPEKGIICSNYDRALRLSKRLGQSEMHRCAWGPFVVIGTYNGERVFVACAPVGTGSGLVFTELFVNGAKYIVRYGSDDVKKPPESDAYLVKIIDEADNLYGYNIQSGVAQEEWGKAVPASSKIVQTLIETAEELGIAYETRICHHLENYHALRCPDKFSDERSVRLKQILSDLNNNPKPASYDMETAVLFRVAKDFGAHAASVLQTVNKERNDFEQAKEVEELFFFNYVLSALSKLH